MVSLGFFVAGIAVFGLVWLTGAAWAGWHLIADVRGGGFLRPAVTGGRGKAAVHGLDGDAAESADAWRHAGCSGAADGEVTACLACPLS